MPIYVTALECLFRLNRQPSYRMLALDIDIIGKCLTPPYKHMQCIT